MSVTDDEFSCLMIAAQGEYMLPIGRWKASIEALASRGLMCRQHINGGPQYLITRAGRQAIEDREKEENEQLRQIATRASAVSTGTTNVRQIAEEAAQKLAQAARESVHVTGHSPEYALGEWAKAVVARAKDLLNG